MLNLNFLAKQYLNVDNDLKFTKDWNYFSIKLYEQFNEKSIPGQNLKEFVECKQRHGESCRQFLTRIKLIGNKIKVASSNKNAAVALELKFEKDLLSQFVLGLFPTIRDKVLSSQVTTITEALDKAELEEMIDKLNKSTNKNQQEIRYCSYCKIDGHNIDTCKQIKNKYKIRHCSYCKSNRHDIDKCRKVEKVKRCFYCSRIGHIKRNCFILAPHNKYRNHNSRRKQINRSRVNKFTSQEGNYFKNNQNSWQSVSQSDRENRKFNTNNNNSSNNQYRNNVNDFIPKNNVAAHLNANAVTLPPQNVAAKYQEG